MNLADVTKNKEARAAMRSNLRFWYQESTPEERAEGIVWYPLANDTCKTISGTFPRGRFPTLITAGSMSALSPQNKWEQNIKDTYTLLRAVHEGKPMDSIKVCTYDANKHKSAEIARGNQQILTKSPKTYAFAKNVGELDENYVTIDIWHLRACQTRSKKRKELRTTVTPLQYQIIQEETLKVAKEFGLKGYEFQAIVWVTIRNRWSNQ
jgi:hypothetical protein